MPGCGCGVSTRGAESSSGVNKVASLSWASGHSCPSWQRQPGAPPLPLKGGRGSRMAALGPSRANPSECDPLTSTSSSTWESVRSADPQSRPNSTYKSETAGIEPAICVLTSPPGDLDVCSSWRTATLGHPHVGSLCHLN